jgi:hypothetical protein
MPFGRAPVAFLVGYPIMSYLKVAIIEVNIGDAIRPV